MEKQKECIGITGIGTYIPENYQTSQYIAEQSGVPKEVIENKMGIMRKPVPGPNDHTGAMGIIAARRAIADAKIKPEEIDVVIWAGEEYKEWPLWTVGIKIAHEVGAKNAWAFDVQQRCGTMIVAMKLAKSLMLSDPKIKTILIASGYRNCDLIDYKNRRTRFLFNLGASGAAVILQKGADKNCLLEISSIVDGSFSEDVYVPAGGTKIPTSHESIDKRLHYFDVPDPDGMKERLDRLSMQNFVKVIEDCVKRSGYRISDIDYLAVLHMKRSAHEFVLSTLGLKNEQTIYLENYGHMGQNDQIISLELALKNGKIRDGDLVVFVSAGIGYAWNACAIKWGECKCR